MSKIIAEHAQANPQLKLPWWLDEAFASSTNEHGHSPVDQQKRSHRSPGTTLADPDGDAKTNSEPEARGGET